MVRFECGCSSNVIMVDGIVSIPAFVAWRQEKSRMPEHIDEQKDNIFVLLRDAAAGAPR